jgi:hypothetical protein
VHENPHINEQPPRPRPIPPYLPTAAWQHLAADVGTSTWQRQRRAVPRATYLRLTSPSLLEAPITPRGASALMGSPPRPRAPRRPACLCHLAARHARCTRAWRRDTCATLRLTAPGVTRPEHARALSGTSVTARRARPLPKPGRQQQARALRAAPLAPRGPEGGLAALGSDDAGQSLTALTCACQRPRCSRRASHLAAPQPSWALRRAHVHPPAPRAFMTPRGVPRVQDEGGEAETPVSCCGSRGQACHDRHGRSSSGTTVTARGGRPLQPLRSRAARDPSGGGRLLEYVRPPTAP